jgi:hypothetical protein
LYLLLLGVEAALPAFDAGDEVSDCRLARA